MYLWRRRHNFWFRKSVPVDLRPFLGPEVRCSLATEQRAVARRRAWALLVALEEVYDVLRSERPLESARALLKAFVDDCRAYHPEPWQRAPKLENRTYVIGGPSAVSLGKTAISNR
jgi:hypothetical protein